MEKIKTTILALTICCMASAMLSSCRLGKPFVKPEMDLPAEFAPSIDTDSFSMADVDWRVIYSDPLLQDLIERVLANNKDLAIAEARINEMASMRRSARADLLPEIGANVYIQKEQLNYGGHNAKPDPESGIKGSISWDPDIWGGRRWADERARSRWMASVQAHKALQVMLVASVAQSYYELVALDNELAIVNRTLEARREGERIARLRWEGGLTSETSYQQAKVELERTITRVPVLERAIALKQNEITTLLGEFPRHIDRATVLYDNDLPSTLPVGLPSTLLLRRPDIMQAHYDLRASHAAAGVAFTDRFPSLRLTASGGLESDELSTLLRSPMYFLSAGLLGPVFDFGRRQGRYRAAQAACEQSRIAYEKTVIQAFTQVSNAITDFRLVKEIYASAKQLEQSARTSVELARLQYLNGVIGYIDVLDAQRSYFEAQIGLSNALRAKQLCIVQLYRVLGGGWERDTPDEKNN